MRKEVTRVDMLGPEQMVPGRAESATSSCGRITIITSPGDAGQAKTDKLSRQLHVDCRTSDLQKKDGMPSGRNGHPEQPQEKEAATASGRIDIFGGQKREAESTEDIAS